MLLAGLVKNIAVRVRQDPRKGIFAWKGRHRLVHLINKQNTVFSETVSVLINDKGVTIEPLFAAKLRLQNQELPNRALPNILRGYARTLHQLRNDSLLSPSPLTLPRDHNLAKAIQLGQPTVQSHIDGLLPPESNLGVAAEGHSLAGEQVGPEHGHFFVAHV